MAVSRDPKIALITQYIKAFEEGGLRGTMLQGKRYYLSENDILGRKKGYKSAGEYVAMDPYKANNVIPSGFLKLIVDQKIGYSLNEGISIQDDFPISAPAYVRTLKKVAKQSSQKIYGVLQPDISSGEYKLKVMESEQIILVPNISNNEKNDHVIRYYSTQIVDAKGKLVDVLRAELYDDKEITFYIKYKRASGTYIKWELEPCGKGLRIPANPLPHMRTAITLAGIVKGERANAWGGPPHLVLYNNDEHTNDLKVIKRLIDLYDKGISDFGNNLEDFNEIYWIIKNYGGENEEEFTKLFKKYKTLFTDGDGDAKAETVDIPHEARKLLLDMLQKLIYKFSMAVNADDIQGNITNVRIMALYSDLNLKANDFEQELQDLHVQVTESYNKWAGISGKPLIQYTPLIFSRDMILNEVEMLDANARQQGSIPEIIRLGKHPWIRNPEEAERDMQRITLE